MRRRAPLALVALLAPLVCLGGPPFLTDDPEPTDTGHWEIYAPYFEAEGRGNTFAGSSGAELNFGAAKNLQLTVGLPAAYTHEAGLWHWGAGDFELSAKYRFYHDEDAGLQVAIFPGVTLPTASRGLGAKSATGLLPIWGQKDFDEWSVFGGGGYAINPGSENRDYWTGGLAITRSFGERLLLGLEADRRGRDAADGRASTSFGLGFIYDLPGPLRVLASGGPTHEDGGRTGFHAFVALGIER